MSFQEENDPRPSVKEESHPGDQYDGCFRTPTYSKVVPHLLRYLLLHSEGDWYFLVMEYCDMGNLLTLQNKLTNKVFAPEEAFNIFNQILRGVDIIHKHKIVHRDLKLENIFVRKQDKQGLVCKIGDFGLARFLEITANSNCGTQNYMAP